ncbi:hypothetical protein ABIA32_003661 [Streptacidiphilus sp. MAP12-20]|uniref:Tat pathway signal sequence domain protein n=1 Tax=Streptacidiphilus sp. MAP12-20 TaxID=3156299 RepID=UPI003511CCFC
MARGSRGGAGDQSPADRPRIGAVSEPELVWGDEASARVSQLSESGGSRLERHVGDWWSRQSRPRRIALYLTPPAALALTLYLVAPQPGSPEATPWPALHSTVTYQGSVTPHVLPPLRTVFVVAVTDHDVVPVTITQIAQSYRGLTLRSDPPLPVSVQPGQVVLIQLVTTVVDCAQVPVNDQLPFVDVTFRNIRAIQTESEILGDRYTADLHRAMSAACRRT